MCAVVLKFISCFQITGQRDDVPESGLCGNVRLLEEQVALLQRHGDVRLINNTVLGPIGVVIVQRERRARCVCCNRDNISNVDQGHVRSDSHDGHQSTLRTAPTDVVAAPAAGQRTSGVSEGLARSSLQVSSIALFGWVDDVVPAKWCL